MLSRKLAGGLPGRLGVIGARRCVDDCPPRGVDDSHTALIIHPVANCLLQVPTLCANAGNQQRNVGASFPYTPSSASMQ